MNQNFLKKCLFGLLFTSLFSAPLYAQREFDEAYTGEDEARFEEEYGELEAASDPLESFNRRVFAFNDVMDRYLLSPLASGYHYVTPDFLEIGVNNFFANLSDLNSLVNHSLQGELGDAAGDGGRFIVNSTVGLFGLIDVASDMGLEYHRADFAQTLSKWGVGSGPYLMVPILGPYTARSGVGRLFDSNAFSYQQLDDVRTRNGLWAVDTLSDRAALLEADELITGDRYIFVRDAYLQRREFLNTGEILDTFGGDDFEWED